MASGPFDSLGDLRPRTTTPRPGEPDGGASRGQPPRTLLTSVGLSNSSTFADRSRSSSCSGGALSSAIPISSCLPTG
ncbi:hypothetical protein HR12_33845 [Microbacterium sp. SUBG005]|nr:hypothetical protein HR12_33845 [Microbacterium sp. SUBG005]